MENRHFVHKMQPHLIGTSLNILDALKAERIDAGLKEPKTKAPGEKASSIEFFVLLNELVTIDEKLLSKAKEIIKQQVAISNNNETTKVVATGLRVYTQKRK